LVLLIVDCCYWLSQIGAETTLRSPALSGQEVTSQDFDLIDDIECFA
jgi:hypothetical protein